MERKVAELLETIKHHNKLYREGHPVIPDAVYDREVEMLRQLDPNNEWFKKPEPSFVRARRKATLPLPMKSLNKVKDITDFQNWTSSVNLSAKDYIVIMPKFDGLSLLCNEKTKQAWSRGGAENEGQDCASHLKMNGTIHNTYFPYTFGEFVFSVKNWTNNMANKINPDTGKFNKSPRNTAAGLLNRDTPSPDLQYVDFYRYGTDAKTTNKYDTFYDLMLDICEVYQQKKLFKKCTTNEVSENLLLSLFKEWRLLYYIDGLVIYIDSIKKWNALGRKETSGNPNYAIAYKHPDFTDSFETTVKGISWKVSKSGAIKPVVEIDTIDTGDCEIDSPTGYNAGWIKSNHIAKGAKILITRSGGVIPKILQTLKPAPDIEDMRLWNNASECPSCGGNTAWDQKGIELCCTNPICHGRRLAKIIFFYECIGAENMGEETFNKLYKAGYTTLRSILNLNFSDIVAIESFGDTTANIILDNNKKILNGVDMATLMWASDMFPGIGKIKAQQVLDSLPAEAIQALLANESLQGWSPTKEELKVAPKTIQSFWGNISQFNFFVRQNNLTITPPSTKAINKYGKYQAVAVCFSGVRSSQLEEAIVAEGGSVVSGVSKKTTYLVVKDATANSSKIIKAKSLKIPILTMEEFISTFDK